MTTTATAVTVPGLPGDFTVTPGGLAELRSRLERSGAVTFKPKGFGVSYVVARQPSPGLRFRSAKRELETFLGVTPLYVTTIWPALTQKRIDREVIPPGRYPDTKGHIPGLRLVVTPSSTSWIWRYWRDGQGHDLGLGSARVGRVSLKAARAKAKAKRTLLDAEIDPIAAKRAEKAEERAARATSKATAVMTFEAAAKAYFNEHAGKWSSAQHRNQFLTSLKAHAFPLIGALPVEAIGLPEVLAVLEQRVEAARGLDAGRFWDVRAETASRVRARLEQVLAWATVRQYRSGDNPAAWRANLKLVLPGRSKTKLEPDGITVTEVVKHHRALPFPEVPTFLTTLRGHEGVGARALEFAILTASRTSEVLGMKWSEIDLATAVWTVPAVRMKRRKLHRVPLSSRALEILDALPREVGNEYVFIGARNDRPSDTVLYQVHQRIDPRGTPHGTARSSFRDWAAEMTAFKPEICEAALAHREDPTVESYKRTDVLEPRRQLMAAWAEFCAGKSVKTDATVIPIRAPSTT